MNVWAKVLKNVEARVNVGSFNTWFKPTSFLNLDDQVLRVQVPSEVFKEWLCGNYARLVSEACHASGLDSVLVEYVVSPGGDATPPVPARRKLPARGGPPARAERVDRSDLFNPKYTFESFVVGSCNQFAHAAVLAVAEGASSPYNPLFLYGGVGLGKTHLMHALAHHVRGRGPELSILYTSSETFMNELVNAIRFDQTPEFRERYRTIDVLLIDDIQFLAGKERTQEEFFHTFNALYDGNKQIVISSDRTPKEIPTLEERLQSRFEWGLIADIQPPDLETKIAILKRKADDEQVSLPDEVAMYMAGQIKSNIRELEGSLIRLLAFSSMTGRAVDLDLTKEVLAGVLSKRERQVELDRILQIVAQQNNLRAQDLLSRSNAHAISHPRQIAMYLAKKLTGMSFPQIGKAFGGKHHTTVMHSVNKVEETMEADPAFRRTVQGLLEALR